MTHANNGTTSDATAGEPPWWESVSMSALLRAAWRAYGDVVRDAVAEAGFDDLPRNGAYVVGATARSAMTMQQLPSALGVTKQAFSQLLDALVIRGYVEREADPADRRRLLLVLTARGRACAEVLAACAERADAALLEMVEDPEKIATTRWVLAHMTAIPKDVARS